VFWSGPAFAPVRRLRAEVGAPLVREDLSGGPTGGLTAPVVGAEVGAAREVPVADGITATIRSLYLSSPLERRRGRGQGCNSVRPEAIAATVRSPGAGVVVAAAGTGDGEPPVGLLLLRRPPPNRVGLFVPAKVEPEFRL
jgi:hypothetical protein